MVVIGFLCGWSGRVVYSQSDEMNAAVALQENSWRFERPWMMDAYGTETDFAVNKHWQSRPVPLTDDAQKALVVPETSPGYEYDQAMKAFLRQGT